MQFKAFEPGIEVSGGVVQTVISAFAMTPNIARGYLTKHGIPLEKDQVNVDPEAWFSLDSWLACYEAIFKAGTKSLFYIGTCIPKDAKFPPHINDIVSGIQSLDVAYHMNHRKKGQVMFDPATGTMLEGIGHYTSQLFEGEKKIVSVCENPYPCEFDKGILTGMAQRFVKLPTVVHDTNGPCRKNGADKCSYTVKW